MQWRLLLDDQGDGAWNMAVDEAILTLHGQGAVAPTLRFYSWAPACLSLGRLQSIDSVLKWAAGPEKPGISGQDLLSRVGIRQAGQGGDEVITGLVRRPTGGRAVWHQHEITYSVALRLDLLPRGETSVMAAYRLLSGGLNAGLRDLGVPVEMAKGVPGGQPTGVSAANCFTASAACDSAVDGKKLIGAAQCRHGGALLQHGSILLEIEPQAWGAVLPGSMEGSVSLASLGVHAAPEEVVAALVAGFTRSLGVELLAGELTEQERKLANNCNA